MDFINDDTGKRATKAIADGYLNDDFSPKKCICGCAEFEQFNTYKCEFTEVEYSLKCKQCGLKVGRWAYGYWDI